MTSSPADGLLRYLSAASDSTGYPPAARPAKARPAKARPAKAGSVTIAIDGPAASGKSTLGAALAERLGYTYFDSGVVYRALTWLALGRRMNVHDEASLTQLAMQMRLAVTQPTAGDGRQYTVWVDGEDVTWAIRAPEVDAHVSAVSAHSRVREALTERLRGLAKGSSMVMVGRDIGTVVLPDADLKLYLTAAAEERARRRCLELTARGQHANYDAVLADLRRRDAIDTERAAGPLCAAGDAIHLRSDGLSLEDELAFACAELARRGVGTQDAMDAMGGERSGEEAV